MVSRLLILALLPFLVTGALFAALGQAGAKERLMAVARLDPEAAAGRAFFRRLWVSAPSSTKSSDGLGPMFDARSCASCHPKAGPGPVALDAHGLLRSPGLILRLADAQGAADPVYGAQLNTRAVQAQRAEGGLRIKSTAVPEGRRLEPHVEALGFGPLSPRTKIALRRAPGLRGISVLARVPDAVILAQAETAQADGVQGRPGWVTGADGQRRLGRFGWKAAQPDLTAQTALAFSRDLGLSTRLYPAPWGDCTAREAACRAGPHGVEGQAPEVAPEILEAILHYLAALPPPAPAADPAGAEIFTRLGCAACHTTLREADGRPVPAYSDLLLHDLGRGLADGIPDGSASGSEWRTAPLWGLSAALAAGGLLHDGRARTAAEAVHWHGGEAAASRARYLALSATDRAKLLTFLGQL